jgi:processive 1,2-diacylglycerol beta-glucosyltransferase
MAAKRKILVFSASFGGGHRSAAEAVRRYYEAHHADTVTVRVIDFFEEFVPSLNVLAKFAYQQSVQFFPALYGTFFDLSNKMPTNPVVHELRLMGLARATAYLDAFEPDAVISTFPVAGGVVADIKANRPLVSATVVTDFGVHRTWLHPATDLYFVACKEVREDLVVRGMPWDRVVVSGIPIHERFSAELESVRCREEFGLADRFTVLFTSIAGTPGDVKDLVGQLVRLGVQVAAVAGHSERLKRRLDGAVGGNELLRVFGFVEEMHKMMKAADVIVGKAGGLTVSEALAMKLPLIIYNPVPGQEIYNVDFIVNYGAGLLARDEEDVVEKVRFLSAHPGRLGQMSANAASIGTPAAAQTVCERVLAALR